MGGGSTGGGGSTMEFFPKAYARGPSQLWLCSGTLLPTSCWPGRPALLTETSILSGAMCRVFSSLLSRHSSSGFSSTSSPCRVGQLAGPPASLSSQLRTAACGAHRSPLAGTLPGQDRGVQRVSGCPRPVAELDEDKILLLGTLNSTSNQAQRGQERYQRFSPFHMPLPNFCWS